VQKKNNRLKVPTYILRDCAHVCVWDMLPDLNKLDWIGFIHVYATNRETQTAVVYNSKCRTDKH